MTIKFDRRKFIQFSTLCAGALAVPKVSFGKNKIPVHDEKKINDFISAPPLGWNSYDGYAVYIDEDATIKNMEEMAKTYKSAGYEYFVIDNGWFGEYKLIPNTKYPAEKHASDIHINEYGLVQPSKCYFSHGVKHLIDHAHELDLKFGFHLMRGIPRKAVEKNLPIKGTKYRARDVADTNSICEWCHYNYGVDMDKPGAQEFYNSLVNQLADWGVDFIKSDDIVGYPKEIIGMSNAIEQSGRDIVFSLSAGSKKFYDLPYYKRANMVRIISDVWDRRGDIEKAFNAWDLYQGTSYEGFYPDLDMIPFGHLMTRTPKEYYKEEKDLRLAGHGYKRVSQFTKNQHYTFITTRALAASPLMIGGVLTTMDEFSKNLLTNKEMIACNQNGVMGFRVYKKNNVEGWLTPNKNEPGKGWMGIFNRNENNVQVSLSRSDLYLSDSEEYGFYNIWDDKDFKLKDGNKTFNIAGDGVVFLKFEKLKKDG